MVAQVAAALTLVACASILSKELWRLRYEAPGYDPVGLWQLTAQLPPSATRDYQQQRAIASRALDGIVDVPGVSSASLLAPSFPSMRIPGKTDSLAYFTTAAVGPEFFTTVRTRMLSGRSFDASDVEGSPWPRVRDVPHGAYSHAGGGA